MAGFDTSASQRRAMTVLGIAFDVNDSYETASHKLQAADVPADGVPFDETWRSAKKLSDAELIEKLRGSNEVLRQYHEIMGDYRESMR